MNPVHDLKPLVLSAWAIALVGCSQSSSPPATAPSSPAVIDAQPEPKTAPKPKDESTERPKVQWDFSGAAAGQLPKGFVPHKGKWSLIPGSEESSAEVVEQQESNAGPVFNLLLLPGDPMVDVEVSVDLRAIAGTIDQGGGVVWRSLDPNNYYVARYNPLEDNFRAYHVKAGRRTELASAKVSVKHNDWHRLKVSMVGGHMQCYLDDTLYLELDDATFSEAGSVGLWTKADAKTQFRDLKAGSAAVQTGAP